MEKNLKNKILVHTDGGARSNPGPAAIGAVIEYGGQTKEYSEFIGVATNNVAEYKAVIFALKKIKQLIGKDSADNACVDIHVDSELLAKQLNGQYKVKEPEIQKLFLEVWNLKFDFGELIFKHIKREENHRADLLVNTALDRELKGKLDL